MSFYRRNLPHLQYSSGVYFVTFRLYGSIPVNVIRELKAYRSHLRKKLKDENSGDYLSVFEKNLFLKYDTVLDRNSNGPHWLERKELASLIKQSIHFRDTKVYDLYAYCIMPNHVHMVFSLLDHGNEIGETNNNYSKTKVYPVTEILANLKKYTSRECNKILNRTGPFWQAESYDRLIRNNIESENTIKYTLYNPVKANLIDNWEEWPNSYCKSEFLESFR